MRGCTGCSRISWNRLTRERQGRERDTVRKARGERGLGASDLAPSLCRRLRHQAACGNDRVHMRAALSQTRRTARNPFVPTIAPACTAERTKQPNETKPSMSEERASEGQQKSPNEPAQWRAASRSRLTVEMNLDRIRPHTNHGALVPLCARGKQKTEPSAAQHKSVPGLTCLHSQRRGDGAATCFFQSRS